MGPSPALNKFLCTVIRTTHLLCAAELLHQVRSEGLLLNQCFGELGGAAIKSSSGHTRDCSFRTPLAFHQSAGGYSLAVWSQREQGSDVLICKPLSEVRTEQLLFTLQLQCHFWWQHQANRLQLCWWKPDCDGQQGHREDGQVTP